jgi:TonB family protein
VTFTHLVADVLAFSAQIACVIAVAGVIAWIVRIDAASVRYQYWRAILLLCVALPWLQPRQESGPVLKVVSAFAFPTMTPVEPVASTVRATPPGLPWAVILSSIVVAGIGVMLAGVVIGLLRLRRFRRQGIVATPNPDHDDLQWALGTRAEIRYVPDIQPVTCGLRRPVVLLPDSLVSHRPEIQRVVLVHELLHVQRRDWIWMMAEEVLRAVLWFHPGIWWLVSRVRLAREEVVDELTVLATGHRRAYLEALLAFADASALTPSPAFARRPHLLRRMMLISKEAVMSSKRIVVSCAVLAIAVLTGSWYAVSAFPMMQSQSQSPGAVTSAQPTRVAGPGPLEQSAKPITPENPIPRRTYSVMPQYPGGADQGAVILTLRVTINGLGRVAEVRSMSGVIGGRVGGVARGAEPAGRATRGPGAFNDAFAKAANDAVRQWIYEPPAEAPISFDVTLAFAPGSETRLVAHGGPVGGSTGGRNGSGFGVVGGVVGGVPGGVVGGVPGGVPAGAAPPPPPPPPPPPGWAAGAIRVGGQMPPPTKTKHVNPVYPPIAESARVQGVVILETIIGPDGKVQDARVLRSIPLLDQAALDAVKQWEFTPTLLNGSPVPIVMTVTVQFTLS